MKYQLKPITTGSTDLDIEKTVYVIARCLSLAGFSIEENIYNQLLKEEKELFTFGALNISEIVNG